MRRSVTPIIAAVLLLLPVLYVGSYLALVVPRGKAVWEQNRVACSPYLIYYRVDIAILDRLLWPLEQIDRKVRPGAWEHVDFNT
jgi:hypothetical protein